MAQTLTTHPLTSHRTRREIARLPRWPPKRRTGHYGPSNNSAVEAADARWLRQPSSPRSFGPPVRTVKFPALAGGRGRAQAPTVALSSAADDSASAAALRGWFVQSLLLGMLLERHAGRKADSPASKSEPMREPLTEAELRVLRFLPTNLSKREIGNELYLSMHTIKTHTKHLYAKLDAHSRREAVERARDLGIL